MRRFLIGLAAAIVFAGPLLAAPSPAAPSRAGRSQAAPLFKKGAVTISQGKRSVRLAVEIAESPTARARGLMHRAKLPEGAGMLFVYPASAPREFWMKNTLIPLSVAFISGDFRILEILDMTPAKGGGEPPSYYSTHPARYALEVNRGWFERNGFGVGARVRVE